MYLTKTWKVIIGLATAVVVLAPLLYVGSIFLFFIPVAAFSSGPGSPQPNNILPVFIIPFICLIFCTAFLQLGLQIFYLIHVILNKAGNDASRIILGILAWFIPFIGMPIYYFVYIWPDYPPAWALATPPPTQPLDPPPSAPTSMPPNL